MSSLQIDTVFDIETANWDTFVLGALYDGKDIEYYTDEDDMGYAILDHARNCWAWNGGLYDAIWFCDWLRRKRVRFTANLAGTRIVRLNVSTHLGNVVLRDGCALIPMSLKKAAQMVDIELSKQTGLACICGKACGGYCSITPDLPRAELEILKEYLKLDVEATWKVLQYVKEQAELMDYELGGTVGGSSWKTAKKKLQLGPAIWLRTGDYEFARTGYYGGRVSVIRPSVDSVGHRYDINSAYPAALRDVALPIGEYGRYVRDEAVECWINQRPGIYNATIRVPQSTLIPPLPYRSEAGRICYPVGRFTGAWTLPELRYAETVGVTVDAINSCIVWTEERVIFTELMLDIFANRHKAGKKTSLGAWLKWFANSLTGKFAENPEKERLICNPEANDIKFCNPLDPETRCQLGLCSRRCNAWRQIDHEGFLWSAPFYRLSDCSHIQWSAYLTAQTRITWHKAASILGHTNVIYGDTDSIYSLTQMPEAMIGDQLGQWQYEGSMTDWLCLAPKTYRYRDSEGDWNVRGKGLPNVDVETWNRFANGETITVDSGVSGIKSAARTGGSLFQRRKITRAHGGDGIWYGDRRLIDDGPRRYPTARPATGPLTRPVTVGEQSARQ